MFIGSDDVGEANGVFVSLLASCRMHNLKPWAYLRDFCCLLPICPSHQPLELSPLNWAPASAWEEVHRILALDPYGALTFGRTGLGDWVLNLGRGIPMISPSRGWSGVREVISAPKGAGFERAGT